MIDKDANIIHSIDRIKLQLMTYRLLEAWSQLYILKNVLRGQLVRVG